MTLIDNFRQRILKFWTVRIQLISACLTGLMFIDPPTLLAVWGMMPEPLRAVLPDSLFQTIGVFLFIANILTIVARGIVQKPEPKDEQPTI